jgi:hypothetical protein
MLKNAPPGEQVSYYLCVCSFLCSAVCVLLHAQDTFNRMSHGSRDDYVVFLCCTFATVVAQGGQLRFPLLAVVLLLCAAWGALLLLTRGDDHSKALLVLLVHAGNCGVWYQREKQQRDEWRLGAACADWQRYHTLQDAV